MTGTAIPFFSACQLGTPAPPAVPLPRCGWEPPAVRGRRGPSLPAVPCLPHLRKTGFCTPCFASCEGATPYKTLRFAQVRGLPIGKVGRSLSLPAGSRGGYPPAPPPRPEQGRGSRVPVGRRAASPLCRLRPVPRAPQASPLRARGGSAPRWLRHSAALYLVRRLRP